MRVDLSGIRSASVAGTAPTLLSQWRVGTVLQAVTVIDAAGRLWLDIGNERYSARLASRDVGVPRNGELLQLKVLRDRPVLALETVSSAAADEQPSATLEALRRYLPRQNSPAPLAANLAWMAGNPPRNALPNSVLQAGTRLWQALPDMDILSNADELRQAVNDSGAFLEAKLAGAATPANAAGVANDLKALLLQFTRSLQEQGARASAARMPTEAPAPLPTASGALQPLPASHPTLSAASLLDPPIQQLHDLAQQSDSALARLTSIQVTNSAPDPLNAALLVELPVRHDGEVNMLRLRIEREAARRDQAASSGWVVEAALDLGLAGGLHARVALQGQRIDVQLRASSPEVVRALSEQRGELTAMLREAGLEVQRVVCLHGLPPAEAEYPPARLLDLRA